MFVMFDQKKYQKEWRETHKGYQKEWYKKNPNKYRSYQKNYFLMKKYGITIEQYNQLFLEQMGRCKICNRHQSEFKRKLAVDHCHESGEVRGLLCHHCNKGLGHFFEDASIMERAIAYLKKMKTLKKFSTLFI